MTPTFWNFSWKFIHFWRRQPPLNQADYKTFCAFAFVFLTIKFCVSLQSSTIPTYAKLNAFMESTKPSVMTKSNSEGLDRVDVMSGCIVWEYMLS